MASIKKRPDGQWRARYRDAAGKEHARHFARKVDGQAWLDDVTTSIGTGRYIDPGRAKITVAAMSQVWVANPAWTPSTRARATSNLNGHVLPRWGDLRLSAVTQEDVQIWVNELTASGLAGGTVRKIAGVLSAVLGLAVATQPPRLAVNPAANVALPKQSLTKRRYLDATQVETLAREAGANRDLILLLAYCGLRIGEAAALRVRHVDLARRRLRIEESVTEVNGVLEWSSPKDHQRRSVPYPEFLDEHLAARVEGKQETNHVFPSPRGEVLRVRNMRRAWFNAAATDAGLDGLTPHELRHTAASLAVSAGASVLALQRMLGHDKPSTTLDVYADLFDEDLDSLACKLASVRADALADFLRTERVVREAESVPVGP